MEHNTRSGENRVYDLSSISTFGKDQLHSQTKAVAEDVDIPDTLIYIVPFSDDKGFAVLSASRLLNSSIICVTEDGKSLTAEDFEKAYDFLNEQKNDENCTDRENIQMEEMGESLVPALLLSSMVRQIQDGPSEYLNESLTKSTIIVSQYGPQVLTKWHQRAPFSDLYGGNAVGCCTIAVSQILVSNGSSPNMSFSGKLCTWTTLRSVCNYQTPFYSGSIEAQSQAASFINHVMNKNNLDGTGSSSSSIKAKKVFENFGYTDVVRHWGYGSSTQSAVNTCLKAGLPIYVDGLKSWSTKGHCWIIDGAMVRNENGSEKRYHHINWGWRGLMDGYYTEHVYRVSDRQFYDTTIDANTHTLTTSDDDNYSWDLWFITYSGVKYANSL